MRKTTTTKYYTIPLRSPNGAPPRYVAIPMPANDHRGKQQNDGNSTPAPSKAEMTTKLKVQTVPKPNPVERRARSVPLQEMREAVIDVRDNARRGGGGNDNDHRQRDDSSPGISTNKLADMPADDLHPLKYWEV